MSLRKIIIAASSSLAFCLTTCLAVQTPVSLGIDQLLTSHYIKLIENKRVAIVANNSSRDSFGKRDISLLYYHPNIKLTAIFTPEHGLNVNLDNGHIHDSIDPITHLPVYSLYGRHRSPTSKELAHVDVILFDLQSVGLRYYTYISTLAHVMNMAKRYHKELIILDRPNPLGDKIVAGPLLDSDFIGDFTSYYDIPMRYGMTIGELALYYNKYHHKHVNLKVIPMQGWHANMLYNQTGLKWIATSPALQTFKQSYLYALFGPLESTHLSFGVGRAGNQEYHLFGAPYITHTQAYAILNKINAAHLPGLTFSYASWRPVGGNYRYHWCRGIRIDITNYSKLKGFYSTLVVLEAFHHVLGNRLDIIGTDNMLGQRWVRRAIANDEPVNVILKAVNNENKMYLIKRRSVLLYTKS